MNVVKINGKDYMRVGDKLIEVDENGKPKGVWSEETPNANGGMDCTVHVECLQIETSKPKIKE